MIWSNQNLWLQTIDAFFVHEVALKCKKMHNKILTDYIDL